MLKSTFLGVGGKTKGRQAYTTGWRWDVLRVFVARRATKKMASSSVSVSWTTDKRLAADVCQALVGCDRACAPACLPACDVPMCCSFITIR